MATRERITVIYKSGATFDFTCDGFKVRKQDATLLSVEWENARPRPLHFGVDDVAAIWHHNPSKKGTS